MDYAEEPGRPVTCSGVHRNGVLHRVQFGAAGPTATEGAVGARAPDEEDGVPARAGRDAGAPICRLGDDELNCGLSGQPRWKQRDCCGEGCK